jgi:hypothetical protein
LDVISTKDFNGSQNMAASAAVKNPRNSNLTFICVGIYVAILIAGLWPLQFHPRNQVSWSKNGHGVHFEEPGIVYTVEGWNSRGLNRSHPGNNAVTLQLGIQPGTESRAGVNPILTFWDATREKNFTLVQWGTVLLVQGWLKDQTGRVFYGQRGLSGGLRQGKPQSVFITSGREGITCYINSVRGNRHADLTFDMSNFRGRIVLGDSPRGKNQWVGDLLELALYDHALEAGEVSDLDRIPLCEMSLQLAKNEGAEAVYAFSEGSGLWVHDRMGFAPNLLVPRYYQRLKITFLMPPWRDFRLRWSYFKDVGINILGFVPLGLFTALFFESSLRLSQHRAALLTILAGFGTSLFIEVIQAYLPTRVSDLTDIICNVAGTECGVILLRVDLQRFLPAKWMSRLRA